MPTTNPADMTLTELASALRRLSEERQHAGPKRREVIVRVCDACLDEVLARRVSTHA